MAKTLQQFLNEDHLYEAILVTSFKGHGVGVEEPAKQLAQLANKHKAIAQRVSNDGGSVEHAVKFFSKGSVQAFKNDWTALGHRVVQELGESSEWSMSAQIRRRFRQRITNLKNKNSARRVRTRQWMKANN